jgi:hypothetical protein
MMISISNQTKSLNSEKKAKSFLETLYGDCNMGKLQDFSKEHRRFRKDRVDRSNLVRYMLIAVNLSLVLLTLAMYGA